MRRALIRSASALAMTAATSYAFAQATGALELEEIVVTGVRQSVESALDQKKASMQVTDSIVAEDIGKLPDNSVAEALQRVTGVQITRIRSDANNVLIRGLPNIVTTINDRQIFTTSGRGVALADIPADLLKQVEVYKTQSADQVSGGLAGAINVDLRRPFDFEGSEAAASLRGVYSDETDEIDPIASGLVSNRWSTDSGEFGALLSVSHQDRNYLESNTFNGLYDRVEIDGQDVLRPFVIGSIYTLGETIRDSANLALQWKPSERASFYMDGFYVKYDEDYELNFWIPLPGIQRDSHTLRPGTNVAETWNSSDIFTLTSNQAFARESETFQVAIGGEIELTDRLTMKSDLAFTDSTARNVGVILDTGFIAPRLEVDFSQNGASNARVLNADGSFYDATDSSPYWMEALFDQRDEQEGDEINLTTDFEYETDGGFFTSFGSGFQVAARGAEERAANGGRIGRTDLILVDDVEALTGRSGIQDVSPDGILRGDRDLWTTQWFVPNREFLLDNTDVIRELFGQSPSNPPDDPTRFFTSDEDTYAVYLQGSFGFDIGAFPVDGVLGARYVKTDLSLTGFTAVDVGGVSTQSPVSITDTQNELLPSLSLRLRFTDDLHLRFAASETMVRPNFDDLNPGTTRTAAGQTVRGSGSGGNPNLETPKSTNADLSLEWYFADASLLSGTLFYRDISDYIQIFADIEDFNGQPFSISRPRNTDAKLEGLELAYTQFFDTLPGWMSGFGVQLNYTLVDSNARTPDSRVNSDTPIFRDADVTFVSDDSYNAILIYEKFDLSARLAYNWRSDYIESFNQGGANPEAVVVKDAAQMDFSLGYDLTENITLSFDATNLLDRPVLNYFGGSSSDDDYRFPRDVRSNDRTFGLGVRVRL